MLMTVGTCNGRMSAVPCDEAADGAVLYIGATTVGKATAAVG